MVNGPDSWLVAVYRFPNWLLNPPSGAHLDVNLHDLKWIDRPATTIRMNIQQIISETGRYNDGMFFMKG